MQLKIFWQAQYAVAVEIGGKIVTYCVPDVRRLHKGNAVRVEGRVDKDDRSGWAFKDARIEAIENHPWTY